MITFNNYAITAVIYTTSTAAMQFVPDDVNTTGKPVSPVITEVKEDNAYDAVVMQCVHPPTAVAGCLGLPTNDDRSQVIVRHLTERMMTTPRIVDHGQDSVRAITDADMTEFSIGIIVPNGMRCHWLQFVNNATVGQQFTQDLANTVVYDGYNWGNYNTDMRFHRPMAGSITTEHNFGRLNPPGLIAATQIYPVIIFQGPSAMLAEKNPRLFKTWLAKCISRRMIKISPRGAPKTKQDERDYVHVERGFYDKLPHSMRAELREMLRGDFDIDIPLSLTYIQILDMPTHPDQAVLAPVIPFPSLSQMITGDPKHYTAPATEGVFAVQRYNTLTPAWSRTNLAPYATVPGQEGYVSGMYSCWFSKYDEINMMYEIEPFWEPNPTATSTGDLNVLMDTAWREDFTFTFVKVTGLSPNNATVTTSNQWSSLSTKCVRITEVMPHYKSVLASLQQLAPAPNVMCMQAIEKCMWALKHGLPARDNFAFAAIMPYIAQAALSVGGGLLEKWLSSNKSVAERTATGRALAKTAGETMVNALVANAKPIQGQRKNTPRKRQPAQKKQAPKISPLPKKIADTVNKMAAKLDKLALGQKPKPNHRANNNRRRAKESPY